ncbi:trehalose 6-phosphate phosphatase [Microbacterium sp. SORGH_AS428]|uniref:trehalose-phosphatase n=1 Tax=Microbacterium sp. SORGH_AS_0428 TaxID=3041788 RepID=UPI00285FE43E|nr:trehalose-phosphatase [Microbacterium sp. SORGH_AS_0428]MDR6198118.1 trehalose 6-phosphate phosphatase [Microbacterium sp. SORGH_AS_0428]
MSDLESLAHTPRLLVALDFDGTLSPLVDEPMSARMIPAARRALDALAALPVTDVALVSGRSLADLRVISEHTDDSLFHLAGSHGAETWHPGARAGEGDADDPADRQLLSELVAESERIIADVDGAWVEPKAFGLGLHTRLARPEAAQAAQREIDALMAERAPGWRRRTGRDILEFAFRHEGKDQAVAALRERLGATAVLFAGDDVTDEDALRSLGEGDLGVHVGAGDSAASVSVEDPAALAALLDRLARLRAQR